MQRSNAKLNKDNEEKFVKMKQSIKIDESKKINSQEM